MIKILTFQNNTVEILKNIKDVAGFIGKKGTYVWVDVQKPSAEDMRFLEKQFLFHSLAIEDCMSTIQRPKIDRYEKYLFVVLHAAHIGSHKNRATALELDTFVGENYVVTVHTNPIPSVSMTWERCLRNAQIMSRGTGYLFYYLTDALVDNYFPIIEKLDKEIEKCEDSVFKNPDSNVPNKIFFLKENVMILKRNIGPQREITNFIARGGYEPVISDSLSIYFRDVSDLLARISDSLDLYRDTLTTALDGYLSSTSNKLNEIMKVLTIIATIMMPLTLITGIYGMNFRFMPEISWKYGYLIIMSIMLLIALCMLLFFKKKRWI